MVAISNKLTALKVKKVNAVGRYADGNCLYLYVGKRDLKVGFSDSLLGVGVGTLAWGV